MEQGFFNKDAWRGIVIAIVAVIVVQMVLAWQYYRLEQKRLPQIEQQLAAQQQEGELRDAKETLIVFLRAWQEGNADLATRYLTENAVLQKQQGGFSLEQGFQGYEILKLEKTGENKFRAQVDLIEEKELPSQVEILYLLKILNSYYIDSVERAG